MRRVVGFGGRVRVRGVGQRTLSRNHGWEWIDGARVEVRFGVGEAVPAADSGFRRARLCALVDFDVK